MENIINNTEELTGYSRVLKKVGRVQIPNFLTSDVAESLSKCLLEDTPWDLTFYDQHQGAKLSYDEIKLMSKERFEAKQKEIQCCTPDEYQFLYDSYMIVTAYLEKRNPDLLLHRFLEQINTPYFIQAMKVLTEDRSIIKIDVQATRYGKGHFLKEHNDADSTVGRTYAYVLNLTHRWKVDWGGLLHFTDKEKVIDTMMPNFNALSIFKVPQKHFVSSVTEYAGEQRISLTGWMYNK